MLNISKKQTNTLYNIPFNGIKNNSKEKQIKNNFMNNNKYENTISYPSTKEWNNFIYSYNKSYSKSLVVIDENLSSIFNSFFNMFEYKKKIIFKRRRNNKTRYSANKIYVSRANIYHRNTNITILLYVYNKTKSLLEEYITKIISLKKKKKYDLKNKVNNLLAYKNRLPHLLEDVFSYDKKFKIVFVELSNIVVYLTLTPFIIKYLELDHRYYTSQQWKKLLKLKEVFFNNTKSINFNFFKFNNLFLILNELGIINYIQKLYYKYAFIKITELRSIHLNSDVFSSAVALKLRDRKNKAVRVLRKAILKMVKVPGLHTLRTFDDLIKINNKKNFLRYIKQQVVSGVRLEASGRLTRRLTAQRAIFKYRYMGSLKNIRASYNNISSSVFRGYIKSNLQYTYIGSKTRNGSFGLKGWISSH